MSTSRGCMEVVAIASEHAGVCHLLDFFFGWFVGFGFFGQIFLVNEK